MATARPVTMSCSSPSCSGSPACRTMTCRRRSRSRSTKAIPLAQAYCNALTALAEFFLAYDWHESFDASFFHFFPAMHSPFRDALKPPGDGLQRPDWAGRDLVSFIHIHWPVSEPDRMASVRAHLLRMIALSGESWRAIEAEADNDREWLPNAMQTSPFASVPVDAERIAAWYEVLDEAEVVLEGQKLVPHWRFQQGFNLPARLRGAATVRPRALGHRTGGSALPGGWSHLDVSGVVPHHAGVPGQFLAFRDLGQLSRCQRRRHVPWRPARNPALGRESVVDSGRPHQQDSGRDRSLHPAATTRHRRLAAVPRYGAGGAPWAAIR